jgi:hypothetical protein
VIKTVSVIELEVNGKPFRLLCESDSTLGEVHDALHRMKSIVIEKMKDFEEVKGCSQQE